MGWLATSTRTRELEEVRSALSCHPAPRAGPSVEIVEDKVCWGSLSRPVPAL